jgi:hypothetical protein
LLAQREQLLAVQISPDCAPVQSVAARQLAIAQRFARQSCPAAH